MLRNNTSRPSRSANSLHDITNHRYVSKPGNKRALLDKTDVLAIAKQKRDQLQAERTVQSLKVSIAGLDRELDKLQNRHIPDIAYNISKRESMFKTVDTNYNRNIQKIKQCEENIQNGEASFQIECETMTRQFEEELNNMILRHEDEMGVLRKKKDDEITELENIPPKEELLRDIKNLNEQLIDLDEQLQRLKLGNDLNVTAYDEKLDSEFEQLRTSKTNLLKELEEKSAKDQSHLNQLNTEIEDTQYNISMTTEETRCTNEQCDILQESINKIEKSSILPEKKLKLLCEKFEEVQQECEVLTEVKQLDEEEYTLRVQKLNDDMDKKRLLLNMIDEVKGSARIFCLTDISSDNNMTSQTSVFKPYPSSNKIVDVSCNDNKEYGMSRLIYSPPNTSINELFRNFKVYADMCLKSKQTFNLISISPQPIEDLQFNILSFFAEEYLDTYEIQYQIISLYDDKFSDDSPFTILEDNAIILDRTPLFLNGHIPKQSTEKNDDLTQVKILKIQCKRKDETSDPIDFYSLIIDNVKSMKLLHSFLSKEKAWRDNQIGLIILKLLNYTKSCFVFNINDESSENDNRLSLEISELVQKIRNPPK